MLTVLAPVIVFALLALTAVVGGIVTRLAQSRLRPLPGPAKAAVALGGVLLAGVFGAIPIAALGAPGIASSIPAAALGIEAAFLIVAHNRLVRQFWLRAGKAAVAHDPNVRSKLRQGRLGGFLAGFFRR